MKITRTINTKRNIAVGMLNKFVSLLMPFAVRTVFIYTLGAEYLGLNSLFTSVLTVLNITELGFSNAVVFSMYEPIANDDNDTVCALLNFYRKTYRYIGLIIMVAGLAVMPFLPNLIKGTCPEELNIYVLYFFYLMNTSISYWLFAYKKSIFEATQRNDIITWVGTLTTALTNGVQFILLLVWHEPQAFYVYLLISFLFTIVNNLIDGYLASKKYPQYFCRGNLSDKKKNEMKKQIAGLAITKACQMTRNSIDSIFISAYIGLTMTAIYNNYYYIINAVVAILTVVTGSMIAGIGNSIVTESVEKNYRDFKMINFMYMWISGWAAITILCLYHNFMILWVGEKLTLPLLADVLFALYFYTMKIGDIRATYAAAAGLWWENRFRSILETIANIFFNVVFVRFWGVFGIISATIIPLLIINNPIGLSVLNKHYFKKRKLVINFLKDNILYFVISVVAGGCTYALCSITSDTYVGLLIKGIICVIIPNIVFIACYYKTNNFSNSIKWLLSRIRMK